MSSQFRETAHNSVKAVIEELAALLRHQSAKLLSGHTKLVLTTGTLNCLNRCCQNINNDSTLEQISSLSSVGSTPAGNHENSYEDNVQFLYDLIKQILTLKVTQGTGTLRGSVDVGQFSGLRILELKRIPIHLFIGLQSLRPRLQLISCERCLQSLEDLFSSCGGDRSSPFSWPDLLSANLSFNTIDKLDSSLRLLPALVSLDISHNFLKDLDGLEYLNELEYLNLSYNQLLRLPVLSSRASLRLKVLSFRNNCLEALDGLERLVNLQQVDLAFNCLLDHCNLSPFLRLAYVKLVCLEGNPIFYHEKHRPLTIEHLHQRALTLEFTLDGEVLKKTEIAEAKKFLSNCQTWKHRAREWNENVSINSVSEQAVVHSESNMSLHGSGCGSYEDAACCDLDSSIEINNLDSLKPVHSRQKKKSRRKIPAVREALIDNGCADGDSAGEADICVLSAVQLKEQNTRPFEVTDEHQQVKELESFRQRHGNEWLIMGSKLNVLPAQEQFIHFTSSAFQQNYAQSPKQNDLSEVSSNERPNDASQVSDDVIILNEAESPPLITVIADSDDIVQGAQSDIHESQTPENFPWQQTMHDSDEEKESDDEYFTTYIIQMEKPGSDNNETILVIMSDSDLKEKDFMTGRTVEKLEFRSIRSFETLSPKKISIDGIECENPRIRINFNYVQKDRKERIYTMEDQENYQQFCERIQSVVDANTFEEMTVGALQCLKCSSQFSKDGAKKVLRKSQKPPEHIVVLSSSADNSKGYLSEANACPNCGSEMLMELEQPQASQESLPVFSTSSPYMKYLVAVDASKTSVGIPINQSTPMANSPWTLYGKQLHGKRFGSSCPTTHANEKQMTHCKTEPSLLSLNTTKDISKDVFKPSGGGCNVVQVEVEVHNQRQSIADHTDLGLCSSLTFNQSHVMGDGAGLRRSESDVTILSNPSQSSIMVMPNPSTVELSLAAISESNVDCNRLLATLSSPPTDIQEQGAYLEDSLYPASNTAHRLGSFSSDSLTGSANTAIEKSVYDIHFEASYSSSPIFHELIEKQKLQSNAPTVEACYASCDADKNYISSDESTEVIQDNHSPSSSKSHDTSDNNGIQCALAQPLTNENVPVLHSTKVLMWSCKDTIITYSFQDFSQIDHRLKLFLDMEIFNVDEELIAVLRAGVVPYVKGEEWPGLLVITKTNVYILKITGPEIDQPQTWLQKFDNRPVNTLCYVNIRLGSQAFQLEFGPKSSPVCFSFMLRDADHCNNFISFLMEKSKAGLLNIPESQLHVGLDSDETLQIIREQLLSLRQSDGTGSELPENSDGEEHIWLYLLGYWKPPGKPVFEHISIVTTSTDVFLFTEDFHWPLPHLVLPSKQVLCQPQLISQIHAQIQDLTAVEQVYNHPLEVRLKFLDENSLQEYIWTLAMETQRSLQTFIQALKDPWEKLFGVGLQIVSLPEQE